MDYKLKSKQDIEMAKPSHKHIWDFAKGALDISGSTMDFLMYLSPFVDIDGKVNVSFEDVCGEIDIQPSTFKRIMWESIHHGLLIEKESGYYSTFHILTKGDSGKRDYVKLLKVFSSAQVRNLSLREKRLFYYFTSVTALGYWQEIKIENLYKNKLHTNNRVGVNYFFSFKEIADVLVKFIELGLIELELKPYASNKGKTTSTAESVTRRTLLNSKSSSIANQFNNHFDYSDLHRKVRVTANTSKNHVIRVRIAPEHINTTLKVMASETEFIALSDEHCGAWDELNPLTINYFIGVKNDLYKAAGQLGIDIYRKCLDKYFTEEVMNFSYYDEKDKLANYFMDFYVLKEIQSVLVESVKVQKQRSNFVLQGNQKTSWKLMTLNEFKADEDTVAALLLFYKVKSSINHKIMLDAEMYDNNLLFSDTNDNTNEWLSLFAVIQTEYDLHKSEMETRLYASSGKEVLLEDGEWRKYMHHIAKHGLFLQRDKFKEKMELKYTSLSRNLPIVEYPAVKEVAFYNWLEVRE